MDKELLRALQLKELEIIDEVQRICKKYNIQWYLAYGSVLGAARHKGFIPWDDDIDLYFVGDNYEKFLKVCETELNQEKFFLQTMETDKNYPFPFGKIRLNNTCSMDEIYKNKKVHWGICIDLFKMSYAPNTVEERRKLKKLYSMYRGICTGSFCDISWKNGKKILLKNVLKKSMRVMGIHKVLMKKIQKMTYNSNKKILWDSDECKYVDSKYFEDCCFLEFEGRLLPCPNYVEEYLENYYGNWREFPAESKRYGHQGIIVDVEKSYKYYQI